VQGEVWHAFVSTAEPVQGLQDRGGGIIIISSIHDQQQLSSKYLVTNFVGYDLYYTIE
jgi:hypothetical protein